VSDHPTINIFWFRRDLWLGENPALYYFLTGGLSALLVFAFRIA
jgi:deoxyribodipyrimidine photolyase